MLGAQVDFRISLPQYHSDAARSFCTSLKHDLGELTL